MSKISQRKDLYKIIGVEKECDFTEIKKAYRSQAFKLHPDRNDSIDAKQ